MESEIEAVAERWGRFFRREMSKPDTDLYYYSPLLDEDRDALCQWAVSRLAADRAEREERARPIDAEWLKSIGFTRHGGSSAMQAGLSNRGYMWFDVDCTWGIHQGPDESVLLEREMTRGDVLDLVRILKGGDECAS